MKRATIGSLVGTSLLAGALLATGLLACKPALAQESGGEKKLCVGCSIDRKTTPMTPDGHPDFSGYWGGRKTVFDGEVFQRDKSGSILFDFSTEENKHNRCDPGEQDCQLPNQPPYNDEYMKKVKAIAADEFFGTTPADPYNQCKALGVPRAGVPNMIVQTPMMIAFLYEAAPYSTYRVVYMGGRPHPDMKDYETTYFGDSIGHWEGNTLVVDTIGFNDDSWLGGPADGAAQFTSIHSEKEHTIERLTRNGDTMTYNVTVDDPDALTRPWVLPTVQVQHAGPGLEVPGDDTIEENICAPTGHVIKPNPEDRDIKEKCSFRCDGTPSPKN